MASSDTLQMVGTLMKASMIEALNKLSPTGKSKTSWRKGATTTMPKKPMTTEGSEASSSTTGLTIWRTLWVAISAM